jgi:hypothetical protein
VTGCPEAASATEGELLTGDERSVARGPCEIAWREFEFANLKSEYFKSQI